MLHLGFKERTKGSHRIYSKTGVFERQFAASLRREGKTISGAASAGDDTKVHFMSIEYTIQLIWSPEDGAYIGMVAELPGCMADGSTPEEALANVRGVIQEWIETAKEEGREIPRPLTVEDFAQRQNQFNKQVQQYIENETKKAVNAVLSQIAQMQQVQPGWHNRGDLTGANFEGFPFPYNSGLVPQGSD